MRALSTRALAVVLTLTSILTVNGAVLQNPDFEEGSLSGWSTNGTALRFSIETNNTFNRNYSGRMYGSYASSSFITSSIGQSVIVMGGDDLQALGFVQWRAHATNSSSATGYVQAVLSGAFSTTTKVWNATNSWGFFDLRGKLFGVSDSGFESASLDRWTVTCNHLIPTVQSVVVDAGNYALRMQGSGPAGGGWTWNEAAQFIQLGVGEVVEARARMRVDKLQRDGSWVVAGIKLEEGTTNAVKYGIESVINANATNTGWLTLAFTSAPIARATTYIYRVMICGNGATNVDVYFDDVNIWKQGQANAGISTAQLSVAYIGKSGGASYTSAVDVYVDSWTLKGSTAGLVDPTNVLTELRNEAAAIGTNPLITIEALPYPYLFYFGYPDYNMERENHPACVEVGVAGWKFKQMRTNNVLVTATNTIHLYGLSTNGYGFVEFDQYRYAGKVLGKERGDPQEINTNAPYFTLGTKNNSSAEFGDGPFESEHTYVVGTSLTNFPRRMNTDGSGGWPNKLHIVFQENFSTNVYTNSTWTKYFCLYGIATNGEACNVKAAKFSLAAAKAGSVSNDVEVLSQEIHMGWATETETRGMVDYPNLTYQDHNEVGLRSGWLHNLVDRDGWYMAQSPRGSATIEPLDLFYQQAGNWTWRPYEEYLYTWPNAGSGVRSIFDDDFVDALPGQASYNIGFKIGHENGTNEVGETQYPEALNIRGCGYYRMTDYDGVMAGSFRPMAADIFGMYGGMEDAPLITKAYVRLVPRTTPTNLPDNSMSEVYQLLRSKTNQWYIGTMKTQIHLAPSQVASNGCYFDMEADTWANKAVVLTNHGALACFSQVSMHWRASSNINDGTEGHDVDCVMVQKTNGEWVTHQVLNPTTNIYQRTLTTFASNDVVYLLQQDRGRDSYGFATEAPYKRASSFEITMLEDYGRPLSLDVYENSTVSEIADNVNVTCQIKTDLAEGEHVHYKYRYRTLYAPGVYIINPNESSGAEGWSTNNRYQIEFYATDGHEMPLVAEIYYGNGLNSDWRLINTNETLLVSTNTHKVSYVWDASGVTPGAYYIKATARRVSGTKTGFDVSNTRLQVGPTYGFPFNGSTNMTVVTNAFGYLGTNLSFEINGMQGWAWSADHVDVEATTAKAYDGTTSARMSKNGWSGWSWNNIWQDVPCVSGEVIHVTGKLFIGSLQKSGVDWVACGIKMESTNDVGRTSSGVEFNHTSTTGSWLTVDFNRLAPVNGTDRLLLWVGGNDGTNINLYFDNLVVTSTNTGAVVTNSVRSGYWEGDSAVNVTNENILSFYVGGTYGVTNPSVWVKDNANVTNRVALTNFLRRIVSMQQRVDIPWTNFATINRQQVKSIGFDSAAASNDLVASRMRSAWTPLIVRSAPVSWPQVDLEGMPLFNPGDVVTNVIVIQNVSAAAITGVSVQVVQEYGETLLWLEESPHVEPIWSPYTRSGDRLCGNFEQVWSDRTVNAGSSIALTNVYVVPVGHRVDHRRSNFEQYDWYFLRNYACRAQVNMTVRKGNGDNVYQNQNVGYYRMDDDYDVDNDGMSDGWEIRYSGNYTGVVRNSDTDADGFTALDEYIAGTSPTNATSCPTVQGVTMTNTVPASVWFQTVTGRQYSVSYSTSLVQAVWTMLDTNMVQGDGTIKSFLDAESQNATSRYYKIGVKFQDSAYPL